MKKLCVRRLRLYGNVIRTYETSLTNKCLSIEGDGKRPKCQPKQQWLILKLDGDSSAFTQIREMAQPLLKKLAEEETKKTRWFLADRIQISANDCLICDNVCLVIIEWNISF